MRQRSSGEDARGVRWVFPNDCQARNYLPDISGPEAEGLAVLRFFDGANRSKDGRTEAAGEINLGPVGRGVDWRL